MGSKADSNRPSQPAVDAGPGARLRRWQSGATSIEYGLIAALVALALYSGVLIAGNGLGEMFGAMADHVEAALADY